MINILYNLSAILILGGPVAISIGPMLFVTDPIYRLLLLCICPFLYVFSYISIAGLMSKFGQRGIVKGKFPRDPKDPVYGLRRIYGFCWTSVYYFKPLYWFVLNIKFLKKYMFRLFGYQDSLNFTVYPDSWIRDLPMLKLSEGVYCANRCTLGTNICLQDNTIMVDNITLGARTIVGHLTVVGIGNIAGDDTEFGLGSTTGIRSKIGKGSKIGPKASISHGVSIGDNVKIGAGAFIGLKAKVSDNIEIPEHAYIPNGTLVRDQNELESILNREQQDLQLLTNYYMKFVSGNI